MKAKLLDRIRFWLCDKFGHLYLVFSHKFGGKDILDCKFCGRMEIKDE